MPSTLLLRIFGSARQTLPGIISASLLAVANAQQVIPQRDQVEQILARKPTLQRGESEKRDTIDLSGAGTSPDDAFGVQSILRERPRRHVIETSLDTAVFYTTNAALTPTNPQEALFLNTSLSLGWRGVISDRLTASVLGRYGLFRYDRVPVLDFNSLDVEASIVARLAAGVEFLAGYGFTHYAARSGLEEFYREHGINTGLQRVFEMSRSHSIAVGVAARFAWAEPEIAQRDRYSAYLVYRWRMSDRFSADLGYRYALFNYREGGTGRYDHNHSTSLTLRYEMNEWMSITGTVQGTWNRSNQQVFNFDALNAGGTFSVNARF